MQRWNYKKSKILLHDSHLSAARTCPLAQILGLFISEYVSDFFFYFYVPQSLDIHLRLMFNFVFIPNKCLDGGL